jgi:rhomboid family GlyGly-CTERM serine protease
LRSANCDGRYGLALLVALAALLAPCAGGQAARELLRYQREPLAQLQWWRLASAHVVHLSFEHALLNCAGLVLVWMLFAREFTPRRWLWILCCAAAAIDAGLWFLRPAVSWYLGASGVLHGALAAGAVAWYRRRDGLGAALLLLLIVKLAYEQYSGASLFERDLPLLPDAHLFGVLGGLFGASLPRPAAKPL